MIDDILKTSLFMNRINFSKDEIISFLLRDKVFTDRNGDLDFQTFKKWFFP